MQNKEKIKALQDSIKLQEGIMIESQAQIRQAHDILEKMGKEYKRAMEEKLNLQQRLIDELQK
jgi:hypothetical protein